MYVHTYEYIYACRYGQTGSGKTHTMNALLDSIASDMYVCGYHPSSLPPSLLPPSLSLPLSLSPSRARTHTHTYIYIYIYINPTPYFYYNRYTGTGADRDVSFSYLEVCGNVCTDCLDDDAVEGAVQIGEMLDGRVETRNLTTHVCASRKSFDANVKKAQDKRKTGVFLSVCLSACLCFFVSLSHSLSH